MIIGQSNQKKLISFSDWIDYWSIDFCHNNVSFNNMWCSFRSPRNRELNLKSKIHVYEKSKKYNISIKVVDIFGIKTIQNYILDTK